jgi:hypothetical protein
VAKIIGSKACSVIFIIYFNFYYFIKGFRRKERGKVQIEEDGKNKQKHV